jgi:Fur family ferric uptake transcriptional regulator
VVAFAAMDDAAPFLDALALAGYRVTDPRRQVAHLIAGRVGHFAAADLLADARRGRVRVGRATVFRMLEVLTGLGAVARIDLPTGDHAYLACEPVHHHHVVCSRCGSSRDIDDAGLRAVVRAVARRTGFRIDDHRLELFGLCPDCRSVESAA